MSNTGKNICSPETSSCGWGETDEKQHTCMSGILADFGEDDLTWFHKVPVELVQLGARRSTLKGAHSQGEAGAE